MEAWKAWLVFCAVLTVILLVGTLLPPWIIGNGLEDFGNPGDPERRAAGAALFVVTTLYGDSSLDVLEYTGPSLVLGWHVESVERCPPLPGGEKPEADSYRAYAEGRSAVIGAYTLFGIPRGEVEVTCGGRREWEPYF